jgi:hypothetical protein
VDFDHKPRPIGAAFDIGAYEWSGCQDTLALSDLSGTLNMGFTLSTPTPVTWSTWLVVGTTGIPLWSVPIPPVSPPVVFTLPIPNFPALGTFTIITALSSAGQVACSDAKSLTID